jgi:hypothetical protein
VDGAGSRPAIWIDVPKLDRRTLEEVGARAHLPLELVTYCLLGQGTPTVVPCGAWLYCAWQVPAYRPARKSAGVEISLHMEEVKACLGPGVMVTAHESGSRSRLLLASLLPVGASLLPVGSRSTRERPSDLLVTLAERLSDAYVSAGELIAMAVEDPPGHRYGRGVSRERTGRRLFGPHLRAHRDAIEELRRHGRRWLDSGQLDRLKVVATLLAAVAVDRLVDRLAISGPERQR